MKTALPNNYLTKSTPLHKEFRTKKKRNGGPSTKRLNKKWSESKKKSKKDKKFKEELKVSFDSDSDTEIAYVSASSHQGFSSTKHSNLISPFEFEAPEIKQEESKEDTEAHKISQKNLNLQEVNNKLKREILKQNEVLSEIDKYQEFIDSFKIGNKKLVDSKNNIEAMFKQKKQLEQCLKEAQEENNKKESRDSCILNSNISNLTSQNNCLKERINEEYLKIKPYDLKIQKAYKTLERKSASIVSVKNECSLKQDTMDALHAKIESTKTALSQAETQMDATEAKLEAVKQRINQIVLN